jgi:endonuclease IV
MHQLCVLQSGRIDFYGNMVDWVPRVSFTEYRNFLTDAMDVFKTLESSYVKYHAALDNQQSVNDAVQVAKPKIDDAIADIGKERAGLLQKLTDLDGKIELAGPVVEEKHKIFQKEYEKFKVEVDNAHRFTPGQVGISICCQNSIVEKQLDIQWAFLDIGCHRLGQRS